MSTRKSTKKKTTTKKTTTKKTTEQKEMREIDKIVTQVTSSFGDRALAKASSRPSSFNVIPTGIFINDLAIQGGIPEGCVCELIGFESSSKSTNALKIAAEVQRKYPEQSVVYIDVEGTLDRYWASLQGIDLDRLMVCEPDSGEAAMDIYKTIVTAEEVSMVILDSIPALAPTVEIEGSTADANMAPQARLVAKGLRAANNNVMRERSRGHFVTTILINQWRDNFGYGAQYKKTGGQFMRFFPSVLLEYKKKQEVRDSSDFKKVLYNEQIIVVKKCKAVPIAFSAMEYKLIRSPDYSIDFKELDKSIQIPLGGIDDIKVVIASLKRRGFLTGGGTSWTLAGLDKRFGTVKGMKYHDEIACYLLEHEEQLNFYKRMLISSQREEYGLPELPPDNYLCGMYWD